MPLYLFPGSGHILFDCACRLSLGANMSLPPLLQVRTVEAGDLVPANPGVLDGAADLTGLTYLNEPSILHGLALRYAEDAIYTHAGPVLIALNPFRAARCPCALLLGSGHHTLLHKLIVTCSQQRRWIPVF